MRWPLPNTEPRFREVVDGAEAGEPQIITRHGDEVAVVMDIAEYREYQGLKGESFIDYLASGPKSDEFAEELERIVDERKLDRGRTYWFDDEAAR